MSARMAQPVVRRPNLPLTAQDEADLAVLRTSPAFRQVLADLSPSGLSPVEQVSEAVLLHAVFEAGLAVVREAALDLGYAQVAADYAENSEARRRMSRRRPPTWADES